MKLKVIANEWLVGGLNSSYNDITLPKHADVGPRAGDTKLMDFGLSQHRGDVVRVFGVSDPVPLCLIPTNRSKSGEVKSFIMPEP